MSFLTGRSRNGQVLVQVAMLMVVFLALLVIAIDMGHILSERRHMQNAADAGALAGAWEICFGDPARAEQTAWDYAVSRNGAQDADVLVNGGEVTVYAREDAGLYLAPIFGMNTADVNAMAVASCGGDIGLCKFWPITFHTDRWEDVKCVDGVGKEFYVWNDKSLETECYLKVNGVCKKFCEVCECDLVNPPDGEIHIVGPGHRGWVNLPRPERPYPSPHCADNCGAEQVWCWINEEDGYTGQLDFDKGFCLPGEPGISEKVRHEIWNDHRGDKVNILIWDDKACGDDDIVGTCSGTPYHIVETGCVIVDKYAPTWTIDIPANPDYFKKPYCEQNVKVIIVRSACDCEDECGSTGGDPPDPGEVRSVSLIK